jgi:adenylate cyclase
MASVDATQREAFEERLSREILVSERVRASLLAFVPSVTMLAFLFTSAAYPELANDVLRGSVDRLPIGLFLCVVAAYEFFALFSIERHIRSGKRHRMVRRYVDAFVEVSIPTSVVLYYATDVGAARALLMPTTFIYFLFILLSTLRLDFALCFFTGAVAAAEYAAVALIFLSGHDSELGSLASFPHHLGKAAILLVSGVAAGFVARRLRRAFASALESIEERGRVVALFGQHVSPAVAAKLLSTGAEQATELKNVCVMFLDIRDFTAFSEKRSPEEVVGYLNLVFETAIESVKRHHGIVNKFLGDGFMAIFGAPIAEGNPCADAIDASLEILDGVKALVDAGKIAPTRVGIGVHAGAAVVGSVGSATRKEYTVIGDVVNVASRVETLNKTFGSQLLVTEQVWEASGRTLDHVVAREPLSVRGREQPVRIFELA